MSDNQGQSTIAPVPGVARTPAVQPVRAERSEHLPGDARRAAREHEDAAAVTGGNLHQAYAQFSFNQDTHDVVIRIRDSATNAVINEYPSRQVEEMAADMRKYADTLAERRLAMRAEGAN